MFPLSDLKTFRTKFDHLLVEYLEQRTRGIITNELAPPSVLSVRDYLPTLITSGKRLRPYMAALAYVSSGGTSEADIIPILIALELFHLFALIHDDIIDESPDRHGVTCLHVEFSQSQAILFGDLCFSLASELVAVSAIPVESKRWFWKLSHETIFGQMNDVAMVEMSDVSVELMDVVIDLKTARYTFIYPILMGRAAAGDNSLVEIYKILGGHLGRAFQRLDDVCDVMMSESELGKKPCADIMQGTPTHVSERLRNHTDPSVRNTFSHYIGNALDADEISAVQELFRSTGALDAEKFEIMQELESARTIISELVIQEHYRTLWNAVIDLLEDKLNTAV